MNRRLVIGTRGSKLALWQTNWVRNRLETLHPEIEIEVKIITTKGDRIQDVSLPKLGEQGKGLFTKELEDAMLEGSIDLAVHSLKDLPTDFTEGLHLGAICEREDPRDAFVARSGINSFDELPHGAVVGTSSLRRVSQLRALRPDLEIIPARGNVDTRLSKLDEGQFDAIILAAAGLKRLERAERITEYLNSDKMLSAVGQGAMAIETRSNDRDVDEVISSLNHGPTSLACRAERAFLKGLGGGCLVPIAAFANVEESKLHMHGLVASPDGSEIIRDEESGSTESAEAIGQSLAEKLKARGAERLLER